MTTSEARKRRDEFAEQRAALARQKALTAHRKWIAANQIGDLSALITRSAFIAGYLAGTKGNA